MSVFTTFVGRRPLLTEVKQRLATTRVVTLTGMGGVGKSRVAMRVVDDERATYRDGCWTVDVASIPNPDLLEPTVAAALGLSVETATPGGADLVDFIADLVAERRSLLVLDGCERALSAAADLAVRLRRACPELRILATSRERLGISAEAVILVPPLTVPDATEPNAPDSLSQFESVALFVDRAGLASSEFRLSPENAADVAALCAGLEGIPLALELAAARIGTLSPAGMLRELTDRYGLLDQGYRDAPDRQRSLRACVAWSYDLCSEEERALWCRLSLFAGGCDRDAAADVCGGDGVDAAEVARLLGALVDKSVMFADHEPDGTVRYAMLDHIAEFGQEELREAGQLDQWRQRHARWCAELAARFRADWTGARQSDLLRQARREHTNLSVALEYWATDPEQPETVLTMVTDLDSFWVTAGLADEARHWLDAGLATGRGEPADRALAMVLAARFAGLQHDLVEAHGWLANASEAAEAGDDRVRGLLLVLSAVLAVWDDDIDSAVESAQAAVALVREAHDQAGELLALSVYGMCLGFAGEAEAAAAAHTQSIAKSEEVGETFRRSYALSGLGELALDAGRLDRADELLLEALVIKADLGDRMGIAVALDALARVAEAQGRLRRAAILLGAAHDIWDAIGMRETGNPFARSPSAAGARSVRNRLGKQEFRTSFRRGSGLSEQQAIAYAESDTWDADAVDARTEPSPLTRRETEVADLVAEGLSNPEIAERLVISVRTAQGHVENILRKLGFTKRAMIAAWVAHRRAQRSADDPAVHA